MSGYSRALCKSFDTAAMARVWLEAAAPRFADPRDGRVGLELEMQMSTALPETLTAEAQRRRTVDEMLNLAELSSDEYSEDELAPQAKKSKYEVPLYAPPKKEPSEEYLPAEFWPPLSGQEHAVKQEYSVKAEPLSQLEIPSPVRPPRVKPEPTGWENMVTGSQQEIKGVSEEFWKIGASPGVKAEPTLEDKAVFEPADFQHEEPPEHALSPEQQEVLDLVLQGHNVFFTGSAGTGKSLVLQHIKYHLRKMKKIFAVTAPTGSASILIGGQTLHSWAGIGIGDKAVGAYINHAKCGFGGVGKRRFAWRETHTLIIDEVSMVRRAVIRLSQLLTIFRSIRICLIN